jgi:hypothetical protein
MAHNMTTQSKFNKRKMNDNNMNDNGYENLEKPMKIRKTESLGEDIFNHKFFKNMQESYINPYLSQQVCSARDISMKEYFNENNLNNINLSSSYLQEFYDMGCAMKLFEIIKKNEYGEFELNPEFGDYEGWAFNKENVISNCNFLREHGHPYYV